MTSLRVGILGCGSFAHKHSQVLQGLPDQAEIVAFCDRNQWKAEAFSNQYTAGRAAVFTDHHDLFERGKIDLAVICLPPYGHSDEVECAVRRGVHLLMEKPIALTSEAAWRMVEAAERGGIKTQVGFMFRFGEAVGRLKAAMDSGVTGPVGLMSARYFCNSLHSPWWRVREKSGGQIVEQIIHMFDLVRYTLGEPETVYGRQANVFHRDVPDYTVEDVSATVLGFRSGALAVVYATNGALPNQWIKEWRVVAQRMTAEFTDANHATLHSTDQPDQPPAVVASTRDIHRAQMQDLIDAVRTGGSTRTPLAEGARSLDLVLAVARSAQVGAEIRL